MVDNHVGVYISDEHKRLKCGVWSEGTLRVEDWILIMRALAAALIFFSAFWMSTAAISADITVVPATRSGDPLFIVIEGEIIAGDDDKFRKIAAEFSDAIVALNSEGGAISPAMDIGRTIKLRGYTTVVLDDSSCASACALIWISGSQRIIHGDGEVGFHATYLNTDGTKIETGVGNALVGHYLSQLGFGEKTVVFATLAPPDKILWLNAETTAMSGIEFERLPSTSSQERKSQSTQPTTLPPTIIRSPSNLQETKLPTAAPDKWMGDAKQTIRKPEEFAKALRSRGYQAAISNEHPRIPMMTTGVGGEEIVVGFSGCTKEGCSYVQFIDFIIDATYEEAQKIIKLASKNEQYSHPTWIEDTNQLLYYNFIVIGSDGITIQTLIDNMTYFVSDNQKMTDEILKMREQN
jgi:hypothetical protein